MAVAQAMAQRLKDARREGWHDWIQGEHDERAVCTGHGSKSRVIFENLFFAKRQKFPGITSPPAIVASASHMDRSIESL